MSLARDDVGISGALNALQTEFIKSGTLEKKENTQKISGEEKESSEIKDVFEKKSGNNDGEDLEQLQEDFNSLEIKGKALDEIGSSLERIENSGEIPELLHKNFEEFDKLIEEIASTSAETSESADVKNDTTEQVPEKESQNNESTGKEEESIKKINELRAKVSEKQQQIAELQKKLYHEVNSIVELRIGANSDSPESKQQAENLKNSVVNGIKENPEQSQKIQVTNLNKDLILAMLSLHR